MHVYVRRPKLCSGSVYRAQLGFEWCELRCKPLLLNEGQQRQSLVQSYHELPLCLYRVVTLPSVLLAIKVFLKVFRIEPVQPINPGPTMHYALCKRRARVTHQITIWLRKCPSRSWRQNCLRLGAQAQDRCNSRGLITPSVAPEVRQVGNRRI